MAKCAAVIPFETIRRISNGTKDHPSGVGDETESTGKRKLEA
jgi:hypothetical protein